VKKILYYDVFAGISGDMNLGALVDLGVEAAHLEAEMEKLQIPGFHLEVATDKRKGISGTKVTVVVENPDNEKHRHLRHIEELIGRSSLPEAVKKRSMDIFMQVAKAEAKVHGIDIQKVHFHEVGALDSIADIVGAAICQEALGVDEIWSSPIQLGGGMVKCAHGLMPVPAPATAEIVADLPVRTGLVDYEATTPTGAAILAATVSHFTSSPEMTPLKIAYGIGQRDGSIPNVLRVYLADAGGSDAGDVEREKAMVVECNVDDMNPEWFLPLQDLLFQAGAADVWLTPVHMKKSRPAQTLSVLCSPERAADVQGLIFTHSSSIGLRCYEVDKLMLRREVREVETSYGKVDVKYAYYRGKVVSAKAEFEQLRELAREKGLSLKTIQNEISKLF